MCVHNINPFSFLWDEIECISPLNLPALWQQQQCSPYFYESDCWNEQWRGAARVVVGVVLTIPVVRQEVFSNAAYHHVKTAALVRIQGESIPSGLVDVTVAAVDG